MKREILNFLPWEVQILPRSYSSYLKQLSFPWISHKVWFSTGTQASRSILNVLKNSRRIHWIAHPWAGATLGYPYFLVNLSESAMSAKYSIKSVNMLSLIPTITWTKDTLREVSRSYLYRGYRINTKVSCCPLNYKMFQKKAT